MKSIALYFNRGCPFTTGHYLERAAQELGVAVFSEDRIGEAPSDTPLIRIDDSEYWRRREEKVLAFPRRAFWAIDTHVAFERIVEIALRYPLVFTAQRYGAEGLRQRGIAARWLPLAAARVHLLSNEEQTRDIDVAFVGHARTAERHRLLALVEAAFDSFTFDDSGDPGKIVELYSRAKVVINDSIAGDVNMRIFEAAAAGAVPVTNRIAADQWEGLNLERVEYDTPPDALDKIEEVLADDALRENVQKRNSSVIRRRHLYVHRLETIRDALMSLQLCDKGGKT